MMHLFRIQVLGALAVTCGAGLAYAGPVTLVQDGRPTATVVIARNPSPAARLAALELRQHVELITGARLSIAHPGDPITGLPIMVGESELTQQRGLRGADFKPQEYLIRVSADAIVLMGRDWEDTPANRAVLGWDTNLLSLDRSRSKIDYAQAVGGKPAEATQIGLPGQIELPGLLDDQASCYATYDFLERCCEVRWYGPTPLGTLTPKRTTLSIEPIEVRRCPSLLHRYGEGGSWPVLRKQWNKPNEAQTRLYYRRLRMGGERWGGNHSFSSFRARFLEKSKDQPELWERSRPDFFAVGWEGEGHWRQLCLTNPDLVQQVAQDARDFFDGKGVKGMQPAAGDYFAIVPQDSDHWCKCERCQAVLAPGKARDVKGQFGTGTASDYVFGFVNAVAKELRKTHPDKYITALAYHVYSYPPTFPLEPNVAVAPCVQTCYGYTKLMDNDAKFYGEWAAQKGRRLFLWNYFHHPMEPGLIQGWKCFPCFMPDVISDWVKRYARDGVHGYYLCGIGEQVDYYLYMQTAFNADTDGPGLVDEFFARSFGPAAEPMERFYYRISEINREERVLGTSQEASWERLGTAERMKELGGLMERAVQLAVAEPEKARVETWRNGVWEYMVEGRKQYLKKKRAHEQKAFPIAVYSTGVNDQREALADRAADPHWRLVKSADSTWGGPAAYAAMADTAPDCPWKLRSTASKWITPNSRSLEVSNGTYIYEQTFSLGGLDAETASIVGRVMADDVVDHFEINGANIGQEGASFEKWQDFVVMDHFVAGINTLRIVVNNGGSGANPQGLRVELSGSADGK